MSERQQDGAEERLTQAIDEARREAEERAANEIRALDEDFERERERAD